MIIVGVCGPIGSGKDTVADFLVKKYGFKKVVMSDIITEELIALGRPVCREEMQKLSAQYKAKGDRGVWARKSIEWAKKRGWEKVVISGIRDSKEVEEFKKADKFILIFVNARPEIRFERLAKRGTAKDLTDVNALKLQEERESKIFDLQGKFDKFADYIIENNGSVAELEKEVDKFVAKYNLGR